MARPRVITAVRVPVAGLRWALHRWQSSLTTRVAATTLVLSGVAALAVGITILHQVQNGLVQAAQRGALAQLDSGLQRAAQQFDAVAGGQRAVTKTAESLVGQLAGRGSAEDYGVFLLSQTAGERSAYLPTDYPTSALPVAVRNDVATSGREAWALTLLRRPGSPPVPAVAAGAPVDSGSADYELFYVFPLDQQQQSLALVHRTVLLSGAALVLLLVGIAAVVTRQVVRPVRAAASTAERLASGRHRERLPVKGRDELASLGTSFNRMAEQVEQQISQLRELSRVQQRFVADVSHELRTPVTTVRMAADVLHDARGELPPDLARAAELLQAQLDRFEGLLGDLLEISRHDAGAATLEAEPTDLSELVRRVVESAEPLAERRLVPVQVDVPGEPVIAEVDGRRVERILRNLVSNAIEHGTGHPVHVRLQPGPASVGITVRDHGAGLRPGQAALVFGRFWRADPARARATGGTGLGLSIALEDAQLHGGWLQAWGEPGRGSVFRLTLPWRSGDVIVDSPLPLEPVDDDPVGSTEELPAVVTALPVTPTDGLLFPTRAGRGG
jgi:two-component system sensor histidine kinase MtrB